jgi:hypothetical protein
MTMTETTPPKLPDRPRLISRDRGTFGPDRLYLYGTPARPRLDMRGPDHFGSMDVVTTPGDLARFARELLAFLGEDYGVTLPPWRPASNGSGKRMWFLIRDGAGSDIPLEDRYHYSEKTGNLIRYASADGAQRAADKLNAQEAS